MMSLARACADGRINGRIALVLGSRPDSPALALAAEMGLTAQALPVPPRAASPAEKDAYAEALSARLEAAAPDLICLAGYLCKLPVGVVRTYAGRIMNVHPALLPAFGGRGMYGLHVHQAALDYGVKVSGCTVHWVDEAYDTGPIILQSVVPVEDDDTAETLAARVLQAEHTAYPRAVALFADGRLRQEGRRIRVLDAPDAASEEF